jgi:hypothetical protein
VKHKPRPLTIPLAFFAAYFLGILNATGFPNAIWSGSILWSGNSFGWPSEYLVTDLTKDQYEQLNLWRHNEDNGFAGPGTITFRPDAVQKFSARVLVLNIAVGLAAVLVSAFVAEYWQRYFGRPRQIGLRSYFVLVLLTALVACFARTSYAITWYYSYWPWHQMAIVGIFIVYSMVTFVFAMHTYATANEAQPWSPQGG